MPLETGNYIKDLNPANPTGGDPKSQGDDHLRLIKQVLLDSFPGFVGSVLVGGNSTGVVNAYVLTPDDPLVAYTANTIVAWLPNVMNTGAATINVSGLGVRNIRQADGSMLSAGDLSQYVLMIDTGTEYRILGVTKNYVDQLVFTAALPGQPGTPTQFELVSENNVASWKLRGQRRRSARTTNAQLTVLDQAKIIDYTSGNFTQTIALPALLTDGFYVTLKNSSTGDIEPEAPAAVSTVSGTIAMPSTVTAYSVAAGLAITAGDLVIVRRTSLPLTVRMVATVASYTANTAQTISTITNVGSVATLTTAAPHGRTTGDTVTVAGATPADYNGTFIITVTGASTFTYNMLSTPASTALPVGTYTAGSTLNLTVGYRIDDSGLAPVTISTITAGGSIATVTTATNHGLATGNYVTVSGATPAAYNGQYQITVTSSNTFTYTAGSAPGGPATVVGSYTIQFTDWTITTRPPAMGVDGLASFVIFPGEERMMQCDGVSLWSYVEKAFNRTVTGSGMWVKPPGYTYVDGLIWAGGASGSKAATETGGGGGGCCLPVRIPTASLPAAVAVAIGSGALGQTTANTQGNAGGNTIFGSYTSYGGGPGGPTSATAYGGSGGGALSAGLTGAAASVQGGRPSSIGASGVTDGDFGGGQGNGGYSSYGGAGGGKQVGGGNALYGGAGGGGYLSATGPGGTSVFGGNGGAGGDAASGGDGVAPGGGGGGTRTGTRSGNGARGEIRLNGVA